MLAFLDIGAVAIAGRLAAASVTLNDYSRIVV